MRINLCFGRRFLTLCTLFTAPLRNRPHGTETRRTCAYYMRDLNEPIMFSATYCVRVWTVPYWAIWGRKPPPPFALFTARINEIFSVQIEWGGTATNITTLFLSQLGRTEIVMATPLTDNNQPANQPFRALELYWSSTETRFLLTSMTATIHHTMFCFFCLFVYLFRNRMCDWSSQLSARVSWCTGCEGGFVIEPNI